MDAINVVDLHIYPLITVIEQIFKSYSNVFENIVGVYKDDVSGIKNYSADGRVIPVTDPFLKWASEQRKTTTNVAPTWVAPDSIPLFNNDIQQEDDIQKENNEDIFEELKRTTYIIYHNSFYEEDRNDLIILYPKFAENALFTAVKDFSQHDKKIFARLMETTVKEMLSREYEIHSLMKDTDVYLKAVRKNWEHKKNEQHKIKGKYLKYAGDIFDKLKKESGIEILLSQEAEQIVIDYEGELQKFEKELTIAVKLAINTHSYPTKNIELDDFSLIGLTKMNIEEDKNVSSNKSTTVSDINKESEKGQYSKTERFLNRLETAVQITIECDEKVIGKNVAAHMNITAPAISDGISQHRKRIVKLMLNEPSEWPLLRAHFRPIQNVLNEAN
jgi:hypothetical protein